MTDSAVAHLTGALGKPVWVLVNHVPHWLWLLDRTDSPWYPSLRLFRPHAWGDWSGMFDQAAAALLTWSIAAASARSASKKNRPQSSMRTTTGRRTG
jgi:hypothetical protein